jgi:hypothetical protein
MPPIVLTPGSVPEGIYNVSLTLKDNLNESLQKVSKLVNADDKIALALQYLDELSNTIATRRSITMAHTSAGWMTAAGTTGQFSKVGDVMILVFVREHPVDTTRNIYNEFIICGPIAGTYEVSEDGARPAPDLEADMDTGSPTTEQKLGALINWLENALTVKVGQMTYAGGWEYSAARSVLGSLPKRYDGQPIS